MTRLLTVLTLLSLQASALEAKFPWKLECQEQNETTVLYTRLEAASLLWALPTPEASVQVWSSVEKRDIPKQDEIAYGWKNEYYGAWIDSAQYRYSLWTCDGEDRWYEFETKNLMVPANSKALTKTVTAGLRITIRDYARINTLTCLAHYR